MESMISYSLAEIWLLKKNLGWGWQLVGIAAALFGVTHWAKRECRVGLHTSLLKRVDALKGMINNDFGLGKDAEELLESWQWKGLAWT